MTEITLPTIGWLGFLPALLIACTGMAALALDLVVRSEEGREGVAWVSVVGLVAAMIAAVALWGRGEVAFNGTVLADRYGLFFTLILCGASAIVLLMSVNFLETAGIQSGEFYALVLFATAGMVLMAMGNDLLVIFLALEVMSIAVYVLTGIAREDSRSIEAALKYFQSGSE